jgi:hypothetical protein
MKRFFVFLFVMATIPSTALAQWRNAFGGSDQTLAYGVHDSTLFESVAPDNGVFRYDPSSSQPVKWTASDAGIDFTQGNVTSFASQGKYFFAGQTFSNGSNAGEYSSTDNGAHWDAPKIGSPVASNGTYLFGGWGDIGIARSGDNGNTWDSIANLSVKTFATNGTLIFASTINGIWRSADNGSSWTALTTPVSNIKSFAFVNTILFGANGLIIKSTDLGSNWTQITLPRRNVSVLASSGPYLFAGTDSGVFISTDSGTNWRNVDDTNLDKHRNISAIGIFDSSVFVNGLNPFDGSAYTAMAPVSVFVGNAAVAQVPAPSDSIEIYPNPASGMVTVSSSTEIFGIKVSSIMGTDILDLPKVNQSSVSLDLSNEPSGTYFVEIQTSKGISLEKATIER